MEGVLNGTYDYRCVIVHIVLGMDYSFSYRHWNLVLVGDHLDYILIYDNIYTFIPANYEGIQGRWSILPALCGSTPFSTTSPGCTSSVSLLVYTTCICSQGTNIKLAQHIFSALYLINLALVFRIMVKTRKVCQTSNFICLRMKLVYNRHKRNHMLWKIIKMPLSQVPPYVLVLMSVTSYRIHSIFVLR